MKKKNKYNLILKGLEYEKRKIFIHINTTNPALLEDSPERKEANEYGWEIAYDTMEIKI